MSSADNTPPQGLAPWRFCTRDLVSCAGPKFLRVPNPRCDGGAYPRFSRSVAIALGLRPGCIAMP
jgi:hypothetical protein